MSGANKTPRTYVCMHSCIQDLIIAHVWTWSHYRGVFAVHAAKYCLYFRMLYIVVHVIPTQNELELFLVGYVVKKSVLVSDYTTYLCECPDYPE